MDHMKLSILSLANQCDLIDLKGGGQIRDQMMPKCGFNRGKLGLGAFPCQRDMKFELIKHVGIPPAQQMRILRRRQSTSASFGDLGIAGRGTKRIQCGDAGRRKLCQSGFVTVAQAQAR